MLVFEERGKLEFPEKNLGAERTNKISPHMTPGPGIEPGTHWWKEGERSHHCATLAPKILNHAVGCTDVFERYRFALNCRGVIGTVCF